MALAAAVVLSAACTGPERTASDLVATAVANLRAAHTTHIEGAGALNFTGPVSQSLDFRLSGDTQLPDRSRVTLRLSGPTTTLELETVRIAEHSYTRDPVSGSWTEGGNAAAPGLDPFTSADLSAIRDVVEIDRPQLDGQITRHLRYVTDNEVLATAMKRSAPAGFMNPRSSGEVWIRSSDTQIVRQLIHVSFQVDAFAGSALAATVASRTATLFAISYDMRFTRQGAAMPLITAPPVGRVP